MPRGAEVVADGECEEVAVDVAGVRGDATGGEQVVNITGDDPYKRKNISFDPLWTVSHLKEVVYPDEVAQGKRIRFIYMGRLLEDATTLGSHNLNAGDFMHCVVTDAPGPGSALPSAPALEEGEGEDDEAAAASWEQQWEQMRRQQAAGGAAGAAARSPVGTQAEFFLGFAMGMILGIFALIWVMQRGVSRRHKLGIVCGIATNMFLGAYRDPAEGAEGGTGTQHRPGSGGAQASAGGDAGDSGLPVGSTINSPFSAGNKRTGS